MRPTTVLIAIGLILASGSRSPAQDLTAFVNGEPITELDITECIRLTEILTHRNPPRQDALDELIDEKLKLQIVRRYGLEPAGTNVDDAYDDVARRAGMTPQQFTHALAGVRVSVAAVKRRIKADMAWFLMLRGTPFPVRAKHYLRQLRQSALIEIR